MTGQEFLKKRGVSKTAIFLSCLGSKETTHIHGENGTEYQRGPDAYALMLCCGKWETSKRHNKHLETDPLMVSVESIRSSLKAAQINNKAQYSLLTPSKGGLNP